MKKIGTELDIWLILLFRWSWWGWKGELSSGRHQRGKLPSWSRKTSPQAMKQNYSYTQNKIFEVCELWLPLDDKRVRDSLMCLPRVNSRDPWEGENGKCILCLLFCQLDNLKRCLCMMTKGLGHDRKIVIVMPRKMSRKGRPGSWQMKLSLGQR